MAKLYGDRWETNTSLSEGGQAYTFLVIDRHGDGQTQYVLKRLKKMDRLDRFRSEVEALRSLTHPNVIKLVDFNFEAEQPYLVSEYCSGGNLAEFREQGRLQRQQVDPLFPLPNLARVLWEQQKDWLNVDHYKALRLFWEICAGVAAAHRKGITHRDIKPENILLREPSGPAVVADFGLCYVEDDERHTLTGEVVGPRLFIAPELEDGRADLVSPASDVYCLGKLLYWLMSGGRRFAREKHREPQFNLVEQCLSSWMEHVNRLLDRMIVADPQARLRDADAVAGEVQTLMRMWEGRYNIVSPTLPQPCLYCGQGVYKLVASSYNDAQAFGFNIFAPPIPEWRILTCDHCGHVQLFRLDNAKRKDWWVE